jgi:ComF family protein
MEGFEQLTCCWEYNGIIKRIIWEAKKNGIFDALKELIDKAMSERETFLPEDLFITFVPGRKDEERIKGFNHAEVIARRLSEITERRLIPLLETKIVKKQEGLDKKERFKNVKGGFKVKKGVVVPEKVLLVDDILVSGATMAECCRELRENGAKKVWGFTLTKVN